MTRLSADAHPLMHQGKAVLTAGECQIRWFRAAVPAVRKDVREVPGDTLSGIVLETLGDADRYTDLAQANWDTIAG